MKYNRKYWMDWGSTSSGVLIHTRIWGVRKMPHQRQQNAADHGEGQIGMHRRLQPIIALGAEIAADDDAGPHKQAHKKARHHKDEVPAAGHRRQSVLAHKFSHDDAVRRVIQLLTEIA